MLITTFVVSFYVCCMLEVSCGLAAVESELKAKAIALAFSSDTTAAYPHLTSKIQQTKNETTNVLINSIVASS